MLCGYCAFLRSALLEVGHRSGTDQELMQGLYLILQVTIHAVTNRTVYGILLAIALPGCAVKQLVNLVQVQPFSHLLVFLFLFLFIYFFTLADNFLSG